MERRCCCELNTEQLEEFHHAFIHGSNRIDPRALAKNSAEEAVWLHIDQHGSAAHMSPPHCSSMTDLASIPELIEGHQATLDNSVGFEP